MTRQNIGAAGLTGLATLIAVALFALSPALPIMTPDSPGYLEFSPARTAAYPAFLDLVGSSGLILAQVALYAVCALVLALTTYRMTGRLVLALGVLLALFVNPEVVSFQYSVLTEALFLPVTMLFLSAVMVFVYRRTPAMALAAAASAGLAFAIRPLSLPLVGIILLAILLFARQDAIRRTIVLLLAATLVWGGVVATERVYSRWRHGDLLTSLAGRHVFAKAALIDGAPLDTRNFDPLQRRFAHVMEVEYAPVREWLRQAEGSAAFPVMLTFFETCIQHACSNKLRRELAIPEAKYNAALFEVGRKRILENPLAFARLSVSEYKSLWVLFSRRHPAIAPEFDAYIASRRPLPLEADLSPEWLQPTSPSPAASIIRPAFMAIGFAAFALTVVLGYIVLVRRRRTPALLFAWLSALSIQLLSVFTAVTGLGEGRYTMGMWPIIVMTMIFSAYIIYIVASDLLVSRAAPAPVPSPS